MKSAHHAHVFPALFDSHIDPAELPGSELNDNCFHLRIFLQTVLAQLASHPRLFEATKGCSGIQNVITVNPYRTSSHTIGDRVRLLDVAGSNARC